MTISEKAKKVIRRILRITITTVLVILGILILILVLIVRPNGLLGNAFAPSR